MFASACRLESHDDRSGSFPGDIRRLARVPAQCATMLRNMIDVWPEAVYREPVVETRMFGRRTFFVTDPDLIRTLLVDEASSLGRDRIAMRALAPALGHGVLTSDGDAWRKQRRAAAPAFRPDNVRAMVPEMASAAAALCERWCRLDPAAPIDLVDEMMRTALEIILAVLLSGRSGLDIDAFEAAVNSYIARTNWKMAFAAMGVPAWMPHPGSRSTGRAAAYMRSTLADIARAKLAAGATGEGMLGLLAAKDPETGQGMPPDMIVDNLLTFVAAGHETTALALSWTLRLLCEHPEVEERLLDEIAAVGCDFAADPGCVERLVCTRQVLMEAMRLYPPAPLIVREALRPVRLGPVTARAGSSIHIPIYALHRHQRLWRRPDVFDPDRFGEAASTGRHRFAYLPFGAGPRVCIGMGLALTEAVVVLATMLPRFVLEPVQRAVPETRLRITLRPHGGMPFLVSSRGRRNG